jgi:hypothetical protein
MVCHKITKEVSGDATKDNHEDEGRNLVFGASVFALDASVLFSLEHFDDFTPESGENDDNE